MWLLVVVQWSQDAILCISVILLTFLSHLKRESKSSFITSFMDLAFQSMCYNRVTWSLISISMSGGEVLRWKTGAPIIYGLGNDCSLSTGLTSLDNAA